METADMPCASTPRRGIDAFQAPSESPITGRFLSRSRKRHKKKPRRLDTSSCLRQELPREPNARTEARWQEKLAALLHYIDDGFSLVKINFENSFCFEVNGVKFRVKHAVQAQNIFRHLVRRVEEIGMVVNSKNTAMICVSDSLSYEADAYILDEDEQRIGCQEKIKALGMTFSNKPTMAAQVNSIKKKIHSRYWTLRNLKNSGFTCDELVTVYKTVIRPVADYCCAVYHSSLTEDQDIQLKRLQNGALKCIFGGGFSAREMREKANITTLRERREILVDKFATKAATNPLFAKWFPLKTARSSTRNGKRQEVYLESKARCERLKNSPFHYFRRRLNGKEGMVYGPRSGNNRKSTVESN